jgi:hypothetical protein
MSRLSLILFVFLLNIGYAHAQFTKPGAYGTLKVPSEVDVIYSKKSQGGIFIHSNGFGLGYKFGKLTPMSGFRSLVYEFELVTLRHPKEIKIVNPILPESKGYVFGKINDFFALRLSVGLDNLLYDKAKIDGVEIGYNVGVGPIIGFLKPVYVNVFKRDNEAKIYIDLERYDPDNTHTQPAEIYGGAGFFTGLGQTRPIPGVQGKFAMSFDWAKEETKINCLETGITLDVFPSKVPIFASFEDDMNKQVFLNFFAKVSIGKKKY